MNRRCFVISTAAAAAIPARAGQFTGKIRKSLKWSMAQKAAKDMTLTEAFKKIRACGYEGVEPSLLGHVTEQNAAEWIAASRDSGLIIDGTVGGRAETSATRCAGASLSIGWRCLASAAKSST